MSDTLTTTISTTGTGQPNPPAPAPAPTAKPDDATGKPDNGGQTAEARAFTQAEVDRIVKERLERAAEKAAREQEKARADAEAKALAEQGEFKKLYEQSQARAAELEQQAAGVEPLKEQVKRLEKALGGYRDAQFAAVPEHVQALLKRLDVVEQLEWLTANGAKLNPNAPPSKPAAGGTPRPVPGRRGQPAGQAQGNAAAPLKVTL